MIIHRRQPHNRCFTHHKKAPINAATITSGNELIRSVFCSDLHQEEGCKCRNMLITKLNIMFSAWQHSDGHGLTCVCICMHWYSSNNNYGFCRPQSDTSTVKVK